MSVGRGAFWLCNAWRGCHARVDHNGREATSGKNVIHCRSNMHCAFVVGKERSGVVTDTNGGCVIFALTHVRQLRPALGAHPEGEMPLGLVIELY